MIAAALALLLAAETLLLWRPYRRAATAGERARLRADWRRLAAAAAVGAVLLPTGLLVWLAESVGWACALAVVVAARHLSAPALAPLARALAWWLGAAAAVVLAGAVAPPLAWAAAWLVAGSHAAAGLLRSRRRGAEPLPPGPAGDAIAALAAAHGMVTELLHRTSAPRPNAGIGGLGRRVHIVFDGDLATSFPPDEVLAVAAHELAHRIERHHEIYLAAQALLAGIGLATLSAGLPWLGAGLEAGEPLPALAVAAALAPVGAWLAAPPLNALRRQLELRADAFAARTVGADEMATALRRLQAPSAPGQRLHALFHHDHPRLEERLARLQWSAARST